MENIVELQSQQELAQKIIRKLSGIDPVVLLCGDEGSGRSTVCHLVAEKTDDKMQVIFLPCNSSLSKENLREAFHCSNYFLKKNFLAIIL